MFVSHDVIQSKFGMLVGFFGGLNTLLFDALSVSVAGALDLNLGDILFITRLSAKQLHDQNINVIAVS